MRKSDPIEVGGALPKNRGRLGRVGQACRNCPRHLIHFLPVLEALAGQVDVHDLFHLCIGRLPGIAKVDDTGVGNDHIQTTKGLPCRCT